MQVVNALSTPVNQAIVSQFGQLDQARVALFEGLQKTGEVLNGYAKAMNTEFGFGWWDAKGDIKKLVKLEHDRFISAGESKLSWTRSQIDVYWSRVKDAAGRPKKAGKVSGGNSVDDLNIRDIKTILNRILGADSDSAPLSFKAKDLLLEVADLIGIDTEKDLSK
jgi:hypothetical protein